MIVRGLVLLLALMSAMAIWFGTAESRAQSNAEPAGSKILLKRRTEYFVGEGKQKDVCRSLLTHGNVRWRGVGSGDTNEFSVDVPDGFKKVEWKGVGVNGTESISEADFDFENIGKPAHVFVEYSYAAHIARTSYVVTIPKETDIIRDNLMGYGKKNLINPKSHSYDTSGIAPYQDAYTDSEIFLHASGTYVVATAVYSFGGPTAAVFRAGPSGKLRLLCQHFAPNARLKWVETRSDPSLACPWDQGRIAELIDEVPIDWHEVEHSSSDKISIATLKDRDQEVTFVKDEIIHPRGMVTVIKTESEQSRGKIVDNLANGRFYLAGVTLEKVGLEDSDLVLTKVSLYMES